MARRVGSFGRIPKLSSGNSTSTIAELLKEALAAEWSDIQDAWKNGGTYDFGDGKGQVTVTDDLLLAYMQSRRDQIDPSDPEWSEWNNGYTQTKFSIGESKENLLYQQGKISASTMANWYKGQLASLDPNTEFYRTVAGEAAQWAQSAASSASSSAASKASKALAARQDHDVATQRSFQVMSDDLTAAAQQHGLISEGQGLANITDTGRWQQMLNAGIVGADGVTVYTTADWQKALQDTYNSYTDEADAYTQAGQPDDAATVVNNQTGFVSDYILPTNAFGVENSYYYANQTFSDAWDAADNNPVLEQAALDAYKTALDGIISTASAQGGNTRLNQIPSGMLGALKTERTMLDNPPSDSENPPETWLDQLNGGSSDTSTLVNNLNFLKDNEAAIANGTAVYAQQTPGGDYGVVSIDKLGGGYDATGKAVLPQQYTLATVNIGGQQVQAYLQGAPVENLVWADTGIALTSDEIAKVGGYENAASYVDPNNSAHKVTNSGPVGYIYTDPNNQPMGYSVMGTDGTLTFTTANPFGTTGVAHIGQQHVTILAGNPAQVANGTTTLQPIDRTWQARTQAQVQAQAQMKAAGIGPSLAGTQPSGPAAGSTWYTPGGRVGPPEPQAIVGPVPVRINFPDLPTTIAGLPTPSSGPGLIQPPQNRRGVLVSTLKPTPYTVVNQAVYSPQELSARARSQAQMRGVYHLGGVQPTTPRVLPSPNPGPPPLPQAGTVDQTAAGLSGNQKRRAV